MMKNEKFDARSQNTLVAIRSSILELLQKKRLQEITIAEVCRSAHINRGTFYHHYFDIYDAYESIEDEFFEEISVRLSSVDVSRLELSFFQEILEFISEHCAFTLFIYTNNGKNSLLTRLIDYVKNKYIRDYSARFPQLSRARIEKIFTYGINGSMAVIIDWLKSGSPEEAGLLAAEIVRFNQYVVGGFLENSMNMSENQT